MHAFVLTVACLTIGVASWTYRGEDCWEDRLGEGCGVVDSTMNELNVEKRKLSDFWASKSTNWYRLKQGSVPTIEPIMKVYWTLNYESFKKADINYYTLLYKKNETNMMPSLVPANKILAESQKLVILKTLISDAFELWSEVLHRKVVFEYTPYTSELKKFKHFGLILVISATKYVHYNEHTGERCTFHSDSTLAHAHPNMIHINRDYGGFFIVPVSSSKRVTVLMKNQQKTWGSDGRGAPRDKFEVREVDVNDISRSYGYDDYIEFYNYVLRRPITNFSSRQEKKNLFVIVLHEIGHSIGLAHSDYHNSIMYPETFVDDPIIRTDDVYALRTIYRNFFARLNDTKRQLESKMCRQQK
nr:MAG: metalloproteinase [Apis mellifra filamentous-like virus]